MRTMIRTALGLLAITAGTAFAQNYPSKVVTLIVPYPAGGPSDAIARIVNGPLGKALGQTVIVENVGGVAGALGAQRVLNAPADGYQIFQGSPNEVILAPLANAAVKLRAEDFRMIHPVADASIVVMTKKDLPVGSVDELLALARSRKSNPLSYASVGVGSLYHFIVEDMQKITGATFTHVPYKGNAPAMQDLISGVVDFAVLVHHGAVNGLVDQGRIKVIGQLNAQRSELLKSMPTVAESKGLKDFAYYIWTGFMVRKDTPEPIVERLHQAVQTMLKDPELRKKLAEQSQLPAKPQSLAAGEKFFDAETTRYRGIAKAINLQPQ